VGIAVVGIAGGRHSVSIGRVADDSRRGLPETTVSVFLLDCSFLI